MYRLDSNVIISMKAYFPKRFPRFWIFLDGAVQAGRIASCREVLRELEIGGSQPARKRGERLRAGTREDALLAAVPPRVLRRICPAVPFLNLVRKCPLLALSGHMLVRCIWPLLGVKRASFYPLMTQSEHRPVLERSPQFRLLFQI